jgi:DNA-binding PadR family transcriptional regulator
MSPVFGHGRLRLYLLKLLDESPKHGYEIIQQLRERFAGLYAPSAGTVYPRLARLETEGLVRHVLDGGRKVYHITDAGREELNRRADELADLEAEIRASANNLADEIREEVKESARHVREELRDAASDVRREQRSKGERGKAGRGAEDEKPGDDEKPGGGEWGRDWHGWHGHGPHEHAGRDHGGHERSGHEHAGGEHGGDEHDDGEHGGHEHGGPGRPPWGDLQKAWRQQWQREWQREWQSQFQEEMSRLREMFGNGTAGPGQFEQIFSHLRETVRDATEHTVDSEQMSEQMDAAREILERAVRDIRDIFRGNKS